MSRTRVKICCIQSPAEARIAIDAGADAIGLVGLGLSGPEVLPDTTIAEVARTVPPMVSSFLLTRVADPAELAAQVVRCGVDVVQIVDEVPLAAWEAVRAAAPGVRIVQVVHVDGPAAIERARGIAPWVDAVLLDSGSPSGPDPVFGGTGRTHDWTLSRQIVEAIDTPVILAGGLGADNVAQAIATVKPWGVDLCSGVRTDGALDPVKVAAFMAAIT